MGIFRNAQELKFVFLLHQLQNNSWSKWAEVLLDKYLAFYKYVI